MQPGPGNEVATQAQFDTGLEDFSSEDLRMPRLNIDHENGVFKDSLSSATFQKLRIVALGLIKQRVLWQPSVENDAMPLCKSTDYTNGYPTVNARRSNENFPWAAAGWNPGDFQPNNEGRIVLPCTSCRLKEWRSHPDGKKSWCNEQHSIPLLYAEPESEPLSMALFTTQRSSINASKNYFAGIVRQNMPAFAYYAELTLMAQSRGKNTYYVPIFTMKGPTEQSQWQSYSDSYRSVREFLHRPPLLKDADGNVVDSVVQGNVIQGEPVQPQQGFQQPPTWAPPGPQPVTQNWAPPAPVQQQSPAQQAQPAQAQPMPAGPVQQQPVQAQPAQQPFLGTPMPQTASPARDDDDLPF